MDELLNISSKGFHKINRPIKAVQFGEGNFLRGFVDYMFDILNEKEDFNGSVVLVQPINFGSLDSFRKQDCMYTVMLRGLDNGCEKVVKRIVTSVDSAVSCYNEYELYSDLAKIDTLRFVISNTTEAGIVLDENDSLNLNPPNSFPGKLTKFLYERYKYFDGDVSKGLIILPVELIDDNGIHLKNIVFELVKIWGLENNFAKWLEECCVFTSTLVDRIITGFPHNESEEIFKALGYKDELLVTGEPFALWVIESEKDIRHELPFDKAGLPVIFTDNQKPYKQRKVRILNGAHTSFMPVSYLCGNDYVGQSMDDVPVRNFMNDVIFKEVIPTLDLPKDDLLSFADAVIDRFKNPFISHSLLSISLNGVSKWRARCLPSLLAYIESTNTVPKYLAFSLAALMAFYNGNEIIDNCLIGMRNGEEYKIQDNLDVLQFFAANSSLSAVELTNKFLSNEYLLGCDLSKELELVKACADSLHDIRSFGMRGALEKNF